MPGSRFVLTTHSGRAVRNPIDEDLRRGLDDVFGRSATKTREGERASAWLLYEQQGAGPTLVVEICQDHTVIFEQWADARHATLLCPVTRLRDVSFAHALALWRALRAGDVGAVRCEAWQAEDFGTSSQMPAKS